MKIRVINGRRCTDRDGAAERYHRSKQGIAWLAANRATTGFPKPIDVEAKSRGARVRDDTGEPHGHEWYALKDLKKFFDRYVSEVAAAGQARVQRITLEGDPDELLGSARAAAELQVDHDTFRSWVRDSLPEWEAKRPGYIPRPDMEEPIEGGVIRRWKRSTLQRFVDNRPGKTPSPGKPKGGGTTVDDLKAVDPTGDLPIPRVIALLTIRLGRPVSRQTVARLRRRRRELEADAKQSTP